MRKLEIKRWDGEDWVQVYPVSSKSLTIMAYRNGKEKEERKKTLLGRHYVT